MHPYSNQVKHHGKVKLRAMGGKTPHNMHDVDARIKRAIGEHDKDLHSPGHGHTGHTDLKAAGFKSGGRLDKRARGGGTKHKHHTTIVVAPGAGPRAPLATPAATPMPPPGMSGGPMPSPAMQKRGGSAHKKHYAHGGRTDYTEGEMPKNKEAWAGYYKKNSYAKGGSVKPAPMKWGTPESGMDEGQASGEQRIEHSRYLKKRGI